MAMRIASTDDERPWDPRLLLGPRAERELLKLWFTHFPQAVPDAPVPAADERVRRAYERLRDRETGSGCI